MSSDETQSALSRAYNLVEAGNYGEARAILEPILAANKNNADVWWIYAHAVDNPEAGRDALENVVRIDPRYPGASELLAQAQERFPARPKITSLVHPVDAPEAPQHLPEIPSAQPVMPQPAPAEHFPMEPVRDTREQAPAGAPPAARAPRRSSLPLVAVLAVVIIIAAVAVVLLTQNGTPAATPTAEVAVLASDTPLPVEAATTEVSSMTEGALTTAAPTETVATVEPTLAPAGAVNAEMMMTQAATEPPTAQDTATEAPTEIATAQAAVTEAPTQAATEATAESTSQSAADSFAAIEKALSEFSLAESGVGEVTTSLGDTVLVTVCSTPGRAMRTLLPKAMNTLAKVSPALGTTVAAVGVRMLDCGTNAPLVTVAVELPTAQSYAKGDLTDSAFAATWKPQ